MLGDFELILYLAKKEAIYKKIELSTIDMSKELDTSQQTVSRKLRELEEKKLIERIATPRGITLTINEKGQDLLKKKYISLKEIFENKKKSLEGKVSSGLGEGSYYVSLKGYSRQFSQKLGIDPFPGTLNISIDYSEFQRFISSKEKILIEGFKTPTRTFGSIIAYKIKLNNTDAAIIIPERTLHNRDTIELISSIRLRKKFNLKDKDSIKIE